MNVTVDLDNQCPGHWSPDPGLVAGWLDMALQALDSGHPCNVSVQVLDEPATAALNQQYRGKPGATNVLSFPMLTREELLGLKADGGPEMLGDLALAYETCAREAADKDIPVADHAAHLIVHGLLHLAGHDHVHSDDEAEAMERLEINALAIMGLKNPY